MTATITLPFEFKDFPLEDIVTYHNRRHEQLERAVKTFPSIEELPEIVLDQMAHLDYHNKKMKVLALYYGGTLGMKYEMKGGEKVLVPTKDAERLLEPLKERGLDEKMEIVWFPVLDKPIDSTNGQWPHWVSIANAIELLYDRFNGFVIAGGTDTMDYLLAAMSLIFPNMGKPIIGAAAQQPFGSWGEDAFRNLGFAFTAATEDLSGPYLAFYDKLRDGRHVFKVKDKAYDAFSSPDRYLVGEHVEGNVNLFGNENRRRPEINKKNLIVDTRFRAGIDVNLINPFQDPLGLLHKSTDPTALGLVFLTYGAGNARNEPMYDGDLTHVQVFKMLHEKGYPLVLASPMQDGRVDSPYEVGVETLKAGVVCGGDTTGSMLVAKVSRCMALAWNEKTGLDYATFRREMYRSHVGEFDEKNIKDITLRAG